MLARRSHPCQEVVTSGLVGPLEALCDSLDVEVIERRMYMGDSIFKSCFNSTCRCFVVKSRSPQCHNGHLHTIVELHCRVAWVTGSSGEKNGGQEHCGKVCKSRHDLLVEDRKQVVGGAFERSRGGVLHGPK